MRRRAIVITGIVIGVLIALSDSRAIADSLDPIQVTPDQPTIRTSVGKAIVTVSAATLPPRGTRVSVIAYAPDGTMLRRPRRRLLRNGSTKIRLYLGESPQIGSYTVHATVESGSRAFGMPTTFTTIPE